jgi:hypothetical protein
VPVNNSNQARHARSVTRSRSCSCFGVVRRRRSTAIIIQLQTQRTVIPTTTGDEKSKSRIGNRTAKTVSGLGTKPNVFHPLKQYGRIRRELYAAIGPAAHDDSGARIARETVFDVMN